MEDEVRMLIEVCRGEEWAQGSGDSTKLHADP